MVAVIQIASYSYENKDDNGFVDILISFLPWVLFIIVWVFIMNRMSGFWTDLVQIIQSMIRMEKDAGFYLASPRQSNYLLKKASLVRTAARFSGDGSFILCHVL